MTISELLNERRSTLTPTPRFEDLASLWDVSQATVSRWFGGKDIPSDPYVEALADWLDLPLETVLEAIHRQRMQRGAYGQRLRTVEEQVARLTQAVSQLEEAISGRDR